MSVKGFGRISNIGVGPNDGTKLRVILSFVGLDATNPVSTQSINIDDMDPTITNITWEAALKQVIKTELINNHGYTFGLFDSVRLAGETLI